MDTPKLIQVGQIYDQAANPMNGRVYSPKGISPTPPHPDRGGVGSTPSDNRVMKSPPPTALPHRSHQPLRQVRKQFLPYPSMVQLCGSADFGNKIPNNS